MRVFIVAWEYNTGGGFDWYYNREDQEIAYEKEKENCEVFKEENWTRSKFEMEVEGTDRDEITEQVNKYVMEKTF